MWTSSVVTLLAPASTWEEFTGTLRLALLPWIAMHLLIYSSTVNASTAATGKRLNSKPCLCAGSALWSQWSRRTEHRRSGQDQCWYCSLEYYIILGYTLRSNMVWSLFQGRELNLRGVKGLLSLYHWESWNPTMVFPLCSVPEFPEQAGHRGLIFARQSTWSYGKRTLVTSQLKIRMSCFPAWRSALRLA